MSNMAMERKPYFLIKKINYLGTINCNDKYILKKVLRNVYKMYDKQFFSLDHKVVQTT